MSEGDLMKALGVTLDDAKLKALKESPVHAPAKAVTGARSVLRGAGRANFPKAESPPIPDELHRDPFFSSKHKLKEVWRGRKRSWPLWSDTF